MTKIIWIAIPFIALNIGCVDSTKNDTGIEADWGTPPPTGGDDGPTDIGAPDADDDVEPDTGDNTDSDAGSPGETDSDGDGFSVEDGDCDDANASIHPEAIEICNEVDDNCDDEVDNIEEGATFTWYQDSDGDNFGNSDLDPLTNSDCNPPEGYAIADGDCDDTRSTIYPGAVEQCDDVDNDCDGLIDGDDPDLEMETWYIDADGDGYGDDSTEVESCDALEGYVAIGGDLDDTDPTITGDPFWTARMVIEVTWTLAGDDMDLHLLAPGGELGGDGDCHYMNCKEEFGGLDWGIEGETEDNPTLNLDDIEGTGPEVISLPAPAPGAYTVVVHDYEGTVITDGNEVSVRVFLDGELALSDTRIISDEGIYLAITEINVPEDPEGELTFTELDEELEAPPASE